MTIEIFGTKVDGLREAANVHRQCFENDIQAMEDSYDLLKISFDKCMTPHHVGFHLRKVISQNWLLADIISGHPRRSKHKPEDVKTLTR